MAKASSKSKDQTRSKSKEKAKPSSLLSGPSSVKAQDGSSEGLQRHEPSPREPCNRHAPPDDMPVNYFVNSERDFRSYAVKEYDAHQETARKSHAKALREVVRKAS